jgi:hypothetical protein
MDDRKRRRNDALNKVNAQIMRIEKIIEDLLQDLVIADMSAYERLTMVHKFMSQHQRAVELQQTCFIDEPEKKESILIGALMSQMRGEASRPEANRVIPAEENEDGTDD